MADSDHEVRADEHMQLAEVDLFALVVVQGGPEHQEQGVAVVLELRPLVGVNRIFNCEGMKAERRCERLQLLLTRSVQADPRHAAIRRAETLVGLG